MTFCEMGKEHDNFITVLDLRYSSYKRLTLVLVYKGDTQYLTENKMFIIGY